MSTDESVVESARERLTTGWERATPWSDSLVHRSVHAYAASLWQPVARMGGTVVHDERFVVHDLGRPAAFENGATLLQPLACATGRDVLDQVESLLASGRGRVWLWSAWPTPDLRDRGWQLSGHPPLLVRPAGDPPSPAPRAVRVEEVRDDRGLLDWERVIVDGYPIDELRPWRRRCYVDPAVLDDPKHRWWVAYQEGEPVAAAASHTAAGMTVFALGVTLPAARRRGAWRALAAVRLAARPDLPAASLFSDYSRPLAERLGFLPIQRWTLWTRQRS
jgi:hypothetical protein